MTWLKNWKIMGSVITTIAFIVACVIAVESRYAKAEEFKVLTGEVKGLAGEMRQLNQTQQTMLKEMKEQNTNTINAINSLSIQLQRQNIQAEIKELQRQRSEIEVKMSADKDNLVLQTKFKELCEDIRAAKGRLDKLQLPNTIATH